MKLKKTINRYIKAALFAILPVMSACDYLDVIPPAQPGYGDLTTNEASTLNLLYSGYSCVESYNYWQINGDISLCDEAVLGKELDRLGQRMQFGTADPTTEALGGWYSLYDDIGIVHIFLDQMEQHPPYLTEEYITQLKAEAWFLEAYYHFLLLRNYGPIPIIETKVDQNIPQQDIPGRSHFDYCVDWIVNKLDEAAKILPQTRRTEDLERADATICKCLKARVLLYAASPLWNGKFIFPDWKNTHYETPGYGLELVSHKYDESKWERAREACEEALKAAEAAGYRLFDIETANQRAMLENVPLPFIPGKEEDTPENKEFKERVRMLQYLMTTHEGIGNKEIIWGATSQWTALYNTMNCDPMLDRLPNRIAVQSNGIWMGGRNGYAPTWATVNRFYTEKGLRPADDESFYPESEWLKRYYEETSSPELTTWGLDPEDIKHDIVKFNVGREPRYYAWVAFDGCQYMPLISDNNPLWLNLKNPYTNGYTSANVRFQTGTGFLSNKFVVPNGVYLSSGAVTGEKYRTPLIRMAELYLNLAECYAALDDAREALNNLNVIRKRAGVPDLTDNDLSIMSLMDWVRNERAIELFLEGQRYYDIRRWCIADQVLKPSEYKGLNGMKEAPSFGDFNQVVQIDQPFQWDAKLYLVPITNGELYSDPQLVQAPGY